jgi:hypothetical protein
MARDYTNVVSITFVNLLNEVRVQLSLFTHFCWAWQFGGNCEKILTLTKSDRICQNVLDDLRSFNDIARIGAFPGSGTLRRSGRVLTTNV